MRWDEGRPRTAVYVCSFCGMAWDDQQRYEAIHAGIWVAEKEFNGTAGFHLNEMYNPWVALGEMAERFLDAKYKADRGDTEALRAFVNTSLAHVERGGGNCRSRAAADAPSRTIYRRGLAVAHSLLDVRR